MMPRMEGDSSLADCFGGADSTKDDSTKEMPSSVAETDRRSGANVRHGDMGSICGKSGRNCRFQLRGPVRIV